MTRSEAISRLRAQESDLRRLGIESLSLFGSVARGEERPDSDVDLLGLLDHNAGIGLLQYGRIIDRLEEIVGSRVDFLTEPVQKPRLKAHIDRDRVHVF